MQAAKLGKSENRAECNRKGWEDKSHRKNYVLKDFPFHFPSCYPVDLPLFLQALSCKSAASRLPIPRTKVQDFTSLNCEKALLLQQTPQGKVACAAQITPL